MIDILHIDCMEYMARQPDKSFDLAVVDPPYGVGSVTYMPHRRESTVGGAIDHYNIIIATLDMNQRPNMKHDVCNTHNTKTTLSHFGDTNIAPPPEYFKELFRVSKHQVIFGGNYFLLPPTRCFLVWRKTNVPEKFSMAMCEYIWTSFNANAKSIDLSSLSGAQGQRFHPTQKPAKLYTWIYGMFCSPGDRVLDTHLGSGSSAIAAHDARLEFVGCEIDPEYHAAASERVEKHKAQPVLQVDHLTPPKQKDLPL